MSAELVLPGPPVNWKRKDIAKRESTAKTAKFIQLNWRGEKKGNFIFFSLISDASGNVDKQRNAEP